MTPYTQAMQRWFRTILPHFLEPSLAWVRAVQPGRRYTSPMRSLAFLALLALPLAANAQSRGWLGTWTTANFPLPPQSAAATRLGTQPVTLRQVVHLSQGGKMLRIRFSNEFGTTPLTISAAHVAFLAAGSRILPATDRTLLFSGQASITIPAGGVVATDPVKERVPIFSDLVISTALPAQAIPVITHHALALQTTFIATGDQTAALEFASPLLRPPGLTAPDVAAPIQAPVGDKPIVRSPRGVNNTTASGPSPLLLQTGSWFFLKDVEVNAVKKSAALVCFGDSITDGMGSTTETNRRYPDVLEGLAAQLPKTMYVATLNAGISGNRLLHDGAGPSAADRMERDVLSQPGARWVILLEGINDIGGARGVDVTAEEIIAAQTALAQRAHARGLKIYGATLTPFEGAGYYTEAGERIRQQVNAFLLSNTVFDGVIDFDKATRDPNHPTRFLPKYDHGDHLHPSDLGYAAMAAAVPLKLLHRK